MQLIAQCFLVAGQNLPKFVVILLSYGQKHVGPFLKHIIVVWRDIMQNR